jgi:hypothetical protein
VLPIERRLLSLFHDSTMAVVFCQYLPLGEQGESVLHNAQEA